MKVSTNTNQIHFQPGLLEWYIVPYMLELLIIKLLIDPWGQRYMIDLLIREIESWLLLHQWCHFSY